MKKHTLHIQLLGTAAAEGIPACGCPCRICRQARSARGPHIRKRSGAVIDDHLKIDYGPDTVSQAQDLGLDTLQWRQLFVTHSHDDHFTPMELQYWSRGYLPARKPEEQLHIFGNEAVHKRWLTLSEHKREAIPFRVINALEPILVEACKVTPLPARHAPDEKAFIYLIEKGPIRMLYGCDTGVFTDEAWASLKGKPLDLLILECTKGVYPQDYEAHLDAHTWIRMKDQLKQQGSLSPNARLIATHFSHNGQAGHDELCSFFAPHGIETAYDGMNITIVKQQGTP